MERQYLLYKNDKSIGPRHKKKIVHVHKKQKKTGTDWKAIPYYPGYSRMRLYMKPSQGVEEKPCFMYTRMRLYMKLSVAVRETVQYSVT